jgi:F-type H+-transporting ATPase subunit epsilon
MPATVPFKLITPTKIVFEGDAELVIAVTTEGEEGILAHHAPFLSALRPGVLRANVVENGASRRLERATSEGFMQALPDRVTVLVDDAVAFEEVDVAATRAELAEATERQRNTTEPQVFAREQAIIDFAIAKLRLTGHH